MRLIDLHSLQFRARFVWHTTWDWWNPAMFVHHLTFSYSASHKQSKTSKVSKQSVGIESQLRLCSDLVLDANTGSVLWHNLLTKIGCVCPLSDSFLYSLTVSATKTNRKSSATWTRIDTPTRSESIPAFPSVRELLFLSDWIDSLWFVDDSLTLEFDWYFALSDFRPIWTHFASQILGSDTILSYPYNHASLLIRIVVSLKSESQIFKLRLIVNSPNYSVKIH